VPPFVDPNGSDCILKLDQISKYFARDNVSVSITSPAGPIVVSPIRFSEVGIHYMKVILWDYTRDSSG
jgi:hypothetical protein